MPTLPNIITSLRFVMLPFLFGLAWIQQPMLFLAVLAVSLLSDCIDGIVARRMGQISEFGARLDTWADFATYVSLPLCAWWLWPHIMRREAPFVVAVLVSYLLPVLFGLHRYGRLPSHHTLADKTSAVMMGASVILLFSGLSPWPFRLATPFAIMASIEDLAITAILPQWRANVPTVWRALELRKTMRGGSVGRNAERGKEDGTTSAKVKKGGGCEKRI